MRCCKSQHRKHEHERNGARGCGEHQNAVVCKKHGVHHETDLRWNAPSRITHKRIGRPEVPAATWISRQRYCAGTKLPDLPTELAQCRRHGKCTTPAWRGMLT